MPHDTRLFNKHRQDIASLDDIWLFGYGSLIYKIDFPYLDLRPAYLNGWQRRFWQGSHDHRGTPSHPGRVLTLEEVPNGRCFGIAFRVTADVFDHLDHREKNGYVRCLHELEFQDGGVRLGVFYLGKPTNTAFLGPASDKDIATQIFHSTGPSGTNRDYVYQLAQALRCHGEFDPHVMAIEQLLRAMEA